jgi:RpiR family transcriptional regulator, carbohydrate utilization regulator
MASSAVRRRGKPAAAARVSPLKVALSRTVVPRLRARQPSLTPALARIADYVLADPEQLLAQTITELAEQSGSSESSVIRLCRELDFVGFQDFKLALATELAAANRDEAAPSGDFVTNLAARGAGALADTDKLLDRATLRTVVDRLAAAAQIHLFGVAASAITCSYLAYKLMRLGLRATVPQDAHSAMMLASTARPRDVFVVVSSTGSTIDSVQIAQRAKASGAFVAAITNRSKSPLVLASDAVLLASSPETPLTGGAYASKISQLLIVDAIFAGLAEHRPDLVDRIAQTASSVSDRSF